MNIRRVISVVLAVLFFVSFLTSCSHKYVKSSGVNYKNYPKREFRGVWMHTVNNTLFAKMSSSDMQAYLRKQLDEYQNNGINAIVFQVRPAADAFYKSELEPWSRYLTGVQGKAPSPIWDPLEFMVEECHKRNMELHAWLNPYRVATNKSQTFASDHIIHKHPEYFIQYGKQIFFQPGEPWCRQFICKVVEDIVKRYDIDAIHMDDYFYPYPIAGEQFPDLDCFLKYAKLQGFDKDHVADWRRDNVNLLIQQLSYAIKATKPWVKFGLSPFGIYRNKKDTPDQSGSETNGLTNYHQLYADVLLWVKEGWIDYNIPQIYWEIGHPLADYSILIDWWAKHNYNKPLYIGQSIARTTLKKDLKHPEQNQLTSKMYQVREHAAIHGNCFWPGNLILNNTGGIADSLQNYYHRFPSLIPVIYDVDHIAPPAIKKIKVAWTPAGYFISWKKRQMKSPLNQQARYCVYQFRKDEPIDLDNPSKIKAITTNCYYQLPYNDGSNEFVYVISALDRCHNESKGRIVKVKL